MNLKGKIIALLLVIVIGTILLSVVEEKLNPTVNELTVDIKQQHIQDMESGANPSIGTTTIAEDGTVGKNFVSHLPLVVIDIGNQKIPVTKRFAFNEYGDEIIEHTGADPYVEGYIHLIDNPDYINSLTDTATMTSNMKIKYRGNTSLTLEKKQYGIKLYNEDGTNRRESVLGMTANNDWVLNGSMIDSTLIRNYMSYNLGSVFFPYTTEVRYCEVILKRGDIYKYQGVYLMM